MAWWNRAKAPEEERVISKETLPGEWMATGALLDFLTATPVHVNIERALGVPAVWGAVNFISNTISTLPLQLFRRGEDDSHQALKQSPLYAVLHDAPNLEWTASDFWKYMLWQPLTGGRGAAYIERAGNNRVLNLWPLDPACTEVKKMGVQRVYREKRDGGGYNEYASNEVIDLTFAIDHDQVTALSPIYCNRESIGLNIALQQYASKLYQNGGVPPLSLEGPFQSPGAVQRASDDVQRAIERAAKEGKPVLPLPMGHSLKGIAIEPEKAQYIEGRLYALQEVARIYGLPPAFLQDLTHGTFTNTEQQNLQVVQHTLSHWVKRVEQQLNLKLFGRVNTSEFVEFNVDGLLRGDFKTRMEGMSKAVQNALMTPNEGRGKLNLPAMPGGDNLIIQQNMIGLGGLNGNGNQNANGDGDGAASE